MRHIILALALLFAHAAGAQTGAFPPGTFSNKAASDPSTVAYTGPGDCAGCPSTQPAAWWALRGISGSFSGSVADICDAATAGVCVTATWAGSTLTVPTVSGLVCGVGINCVVKKMYDQTGNGRDISQSTLSKMPAFTPNAIGSLPGITFVRASSQELVSAGNLPATANPTTSSYVAKRTASFTNVNTIIGTTDGSWQSGFGNAANTVFLYNGASIITATANDNSFHAVQTIFNTSSSDLYVDGSTNPVTDTGNAGVTASIADVGGGTIGNAVDGVLLEDGIWLVGFSAGNKSSMNSNQHGYWGF